MDDYYLNLLDWSVTGKLAVALEGSVFLWDSDTGSVCLTSTVHEMISWFPGHESLHAS